MKVGTLKWMTDNTGPTDQRHSSRPWTSSGNGRGKLEAGSLFKSPHLTQPPGSLNKLLLPKWTVPVQFSAFCPPKRSLFVPYLLPVSPRESHDPQGRDLYSSGQGSSLPSSGLDTDQEACIPWITNHLVGVVTANLQSVNSLKLARVDSSDSTS